MEEGGRNETTKAYLFSRIPHAKQVVHQSPRFIVG